MPPLFITATDTDVGKTLVTALLARKRQRAGQPFAVFKPMATGARRAHGVLVAEDAEFLAYALDLPTPPEQLCACCYESPAAPPVAAAREGTRVDFEALVARCRRFLDEHSGAILEGIGGLLCPLDEQRGVADLIARLQIPALIVARASLGTMNHTLMTVEVARARQLPLAGVVFTGAATQIERLALLELQRRLDVPCWGVLPLLGTRGRWLTRTELDRLALHLQESADEESTRG